MKENPLVALNKMGQSFWYDNISRDFIRSGDLAKMVAKDGLRGITTNPSIFYKAIKEGNVYDDQIKALPKDMSAKEIFYEIACQDVQEAADILMPIYEQSKATDGFVSIEVDPNYAYDTQKTINEAHALIKKINRKNIMIKVPGTTNGLPAIKQLTVDGINVNATLLFSVARYNEVTEAYIEGLEQRLKNGGYLNDVFSVASFFISRIDTTADKLLNDRLSSSSNEEEISWIESLKGKTAIANAKIAYQTMITQFSNQRFINLRREGANIQKLLWASTSTKNPNYNDCMYVTELIGPKTINTMPMATVAAFKDHGIIKRSIDANVDYALNIMNSLEDLNINVGNITAELEEEGVKLFIDAFNSLLELIHKNK
ncbi:MAG: transaldolase [Candidatus Magnetoovum sp. WYHC-5]|nr:transaldolase [Candidatus Magnetoovum sp. WYHC-5]